MNAGSKATKNPRIIIVYNVHDFMRGLPDEFLRALRFSFPLWHFHIHCMHCLFFLKGGAKCQVVFYSTENKNMETSEESNKSVSLSLFFYTALINRW